MLIPAKLRQRFLSRWGPATQMCCYLVRQQQPGLNRWAHWAMATLSSSVGAFMDSQHWPREDGGLGHAEAETPEKVMHRAYDGPSQCAS